MLVELHVRDLGVIEDVRLDLGPGMTALTGETGAGKTLLVEALELLMGGRGDPGLVRAGAEEALVEGRFLVDDEERVPVRTLPARGRSRAWIGGRMAPVGALADAVAPLVELHGQHAHQALLAPATQRRALDAYAGVDTRPLQDARAHLRRRLARLDQLGGDRRTRRRELELLEFQLDEIEAAEVREAGEDARLADEEELLAEAGEHRRVAFEVAALLDGEPPGPGAGDLLGQAVGSLAGRFPLAALADRTGSLHAEVVDLASELRRAGERIEEDPARLAQVRLRRQQLHDLARKYGGSLDAVIAEAALLRARRAELEAAEVETAELEDEIATATAAVESEEAAVATRRRAAAPDLAAAVTDRLRTLAMGSARLDVAVDGTAGEDVRFLLTANPGSPPAPLARAASGGELARAMLALRLVCSGAPPTMVFDEVDAGVGGAAALAVGASLAELAGEQQVLVVTHLAQVAAHATDQVAVRKLVAAGRTRSEAGVVAGEARLEELARMLSGQPGSATARRHAEELVASVAPGRPIDAPGPGAALDS